MEMLEVSRSLAAIAQNGLAYSKDPFDIERFHAVRTLADKVASFAMGATDFVWPVETGYATPKVDVRGAVFRGGSVLLAKEVSSGRWTLPGGWADVNLSPAENVEKECLEETGFVVRATRLAVLVDRDKAGHPPLPESIYKIYFLCEIVAGSARTSLESMAVDFFPVDNLPELDEGRVRAAHIAHCHAMHTGAVTLPIFN